METQSNSYASPMASAVEQEQFRLKGVWLFLSRFAVLSIVTIALGLFVIALPGRLAELQNMAIIAKSQFLYELNNQPDAYLSLRNLLNAYPYVALGIEILLMSLLTVSAAVIFWLKSYDRIALTLVVGQITFGVYVIPTIDVLLRWGGAWQLATNLIQASGITFTLLFFYTFPDGRFVPRATRYLLMVWFAWAILWVVRPDLAFNYSKAYTLSLGWFLTLMSWWITGALSQIYRYRQISNSIQRQQSKLIIFAAMFGVVGYGLYIPIRSLLPVLHASQGARIAFDLLSVHIFLIGLLGVPLAIAFSILRYRLWDIDIVINKTLVYGLLTGVLAVFYFSSILLLQTLFHAITNQQQSEAVTAISTLLIAVLFQPVRLYIQRFIERSFYRKKYDAQNAITQFSETMRTEVDLTRMAKQLEYVISETMQPQHVSLALVNKSAPVLIASSFQKRKSEREASGEISTNSGGQL